MPPWRPESQAGERYASQVGELWSELALTLAAARGDRGRPGAPRRGRDRRRAAPPPVPAPPRRRVRARAVAAGAAETRTRSSPPPSTGARDATGDVVEAVDDARRRGVDAAAARVARRALPRPARAAPPDGGRRRTAARREPGRSRPRLDGTARSRSIADDRSARHARSPSAPTAAAPGPSGSPGMLAPSAVAPCSYRALGGGGASRASDSSLAEELEALEEPGRDLRPRDGERGSARTPPAASAPAAPRTRAAPPRSRRPPTARPSASASAAARADRRVGSVGLTGSNRKRT